jgi:hypothetical protein
MLKDRRLLIEQDIEKTLHEASDLYLQLVVQWPEAATVSHEYQLIKEKIINLQMELKLINKLIDEGNP